MDIEKYLQDLLKQIEKINQFSGDTVIKDLKKCIKSFGNLKIHKIIPFGNFEKETNIKEKSEVKLLISIKEKEKRNWVEIKDYLQKNLVALDKNVEQFENKFIFTFQDTKFQIIVARKIKNTYNYHEYYDSNLNEFKRTNFNIHTQNILDSKCQKEIILLKLWREKHQLKFPTMYLELVVMNVLKNNKKKNLFSRMAKILKYLKNDFIEDKFYDPSNTNNIISNSLILEEKIKIQEAASKSLNEEFIKDIVN